MSRVGQKPILIPAGVQAELAGQNLKIKGPKGELALPVAPEIKVELAEGQILFSLNPISDRQKLTAHRAKQIKSLWGLSRNLAANLIAGVVKGYEKKLEIEGLGYRAQVENGDLVLQVGFSHPLRIKKVPGLDFVVEKNVITVSGIDKFLVGQTAAQIRQLRVPDVYKAKGIRYFGEIIKKKAGKKAGTVTK